MWPKCKCQKCAFYYSDLYWIVRFFCLSHQRESIQPTDLQKWQCICICVKFSRHLLSAHGLPLTPHTHANMESPSQSELEAPDGAADRENRPRGFRNQLGDVSSPCKFTGSALTMVGPIRTSCSHLDHLATFHLHQLTEVLLQEAGVRAPLQQAQQIHWEEKEKNVDTLKQKVSLLCLYSNSTFTLRVKLSGAHFNGWQARHNSLFY